MAYALKVKMKESFTIFGGHQLVRWFSILSCAPSLGFKIDLLSTYALLDYSFQVRCDIKKSCTSMLIFSPFLLAMVAIGTLACVRK